MRKLTYFVAGVCAGTLIGYVIRNSESADFNKKIILLMMY